MARELIAILARHGETTLNETNCFRSMLDPPLNSDGIADADRVAGIISRKYKIYKITSSPLLRAIQTADTIAEKFGMKVKQDRGLLPWGLGFLAGRDKELYDPILQLYVSNPELEIPEGQSLRQFEERIEDFFKSALKVNYSEAPAGTPEGEYAEDGPYHCADCIHKPSPNKPYCLHPEILNSAQFKDKIVKVGGRRVAPINLEHGCCEYVKPKEDEDSKIQLFVTHTSVIVTLGNLFEGKRDAPESGDADVTPGGFAEIWVKEDGDYEIVPVLGQEHAEKGE